MAFNTYGELRQQLQAEGLQWTVNPNFADEAPIERRAMGGLLDQFPKAADAAPVDVAALVKAHPTHNPLLRAHLLERGLLPASESSRTGTSLPGAAGQGVPAGGSGGAPPVSVDWRNRWGWNYVTGIRDQNISEHCWIYSSTALVESMVRIEHCVWCDRSEGDYIEANKVYCSQCGSVPPVLSWYQANGVCDQACVPWVDSDPGNRTGPYWNNPSGCGSGTKQPPPAYNPPSNRNGKIVKVPAFTTLGDITAQKNWIDTVGPLVVGMDIYSDFQGWSGGKPYVKSASAVYCGGHCMLAVGYDDTQGCWIIKNSWGANLGEHGFWLVAYGQCSIDANSKYGLQGVNPDPWTKRRNHSGGMIESGDGANHDNFELVAPSHGNSFTHWWRDNGSSTEPWAKAETMANDVSSLLTLTATTYNRNFELIYRTLQNRLHHWYFDQSASKWDDGGVFGPSNACGEVGFCESDYGQGNFEVVTAVSGGVMQHWWRSGGVWQMSTSFGSGVLTAGPSLLESTWGNLEFVATLSNGQMQHWWRNGANWVGDQLFGSGVQSAPCMIQGEFGAATDTTPGNFELCVAMPNGTVQHWWRDNQAAGFPWHMDATFGSNVKQVVALLQGSFGFNLEMIVLCTNGNLQHYWRDNGGWHAGVVIGTTL